MVPVIAKLGIKEGKMDEAIEMVKAFTAEVAKEEGTLFYTFCKDSKNPNVLVVMEAYKDQAAFQAHGSTPHLQEFFGKFSTVVDGAPEVTVMEEIASI